MQQEHKVTLIVIIATVVLVVGGLLLWGKTVPNTNVVIDPSALVHDTSHAFKKIPLSKVTVVEFGDYQCPACGAAHPIVKQMLEKYKDNANVNFVFRNYPLAQHANAIPSARAAEAAAIQGKFWEMHDMLYEHQADWENLGSPNGIFEGYATTLGLNLTKFKTDRESTAVGTTINNDQKDGNTVGVAATPTFFVNTTKIEGVPSFADLTKMIDAELAK